MNCKKFKLDKNFIIDNKKSKYICVINNLHFILILLKLIYNIYLNTSPFLYSVNQ